MDAGGEGRARGSDEPRPPEDVGSAAVEAIRAAALALDRGDREGALSHYATARDLLYGLMSDRERARLMAREPGAAEEWGRVIIEMAEGNPRDWFATGYRFGREAAGVRLDEDLERMAMALELGTLSEESEEVRHRQRQALDDISRWVDAPGRPTFEEYAEWERGFHAGFAREVEKFFAETWPEPPGARSNVHFGALRVRVKPGAAARAAAEEMVAEMRDRHLDVEFIRGTVSVVGDRDELAIAESIARAYEDEVGKAERDIEDASANPTWTEEYIARERAAAAEIDVREGDLVRLKPDWARHHVFTRFGGPQQARVIRPMLKEGDGRLLVTRVDELSVGVRSLSPVAALMAESFVPKSVIAEVSWKEHRVNPERLPWPTEALLLNPTEENPEEALRGRERQEAMVRQLQELQEKIVAARDSETFRRWLDVQSRFRAYSPHNTLLIVIQRPDATRVAGFRKWQELDRVVKKGESGIMIWCPRTKKREEFVKDEVTGEFVVEPETGKRVIREVERLIGFSPGYVFDVAQTEGAALPELPIRGPGGAEALGTLEKVATKLGLPVQREPMPGSKGGHTDGVTITLNSNMGPGQQAGTLAHELSHVLHRHPDTHDPRSKIEVEAEASTYIVTQKLGIERAGEFYIAAWENVDAMRESVDRIVDVARQILDAAGDAIEGEACEVIAEEAAPAAAVATANPADFRLMAAPNPADEPAVWAFIADNIEIAADRGLGGDHLTERIYRSIARGNIETLALPGEKERLEAAYPTVHAYAMGEFEVGMWDDMRRKALAQAMAMQRELEARGALVVREFSNPRRPWTRFHGELEDYDLHIRTDIMQEHEDAPIVPVHWISTFHDPDVGLFGVDVSPYFAKLEDLEAWWWANRDRVRPLIVDEFTREKVQALRALRAEAFPGAVVDPDIRRGDIVLLEGDAATAEYVVLEAEDERGPMPRILVRALGTGLTLPPTERVAREFVVPTGRRVEAQANPKSEAEIVKAMRQRLRGGDAALKGGHRRHAEDVAREVDAIYWAALDEGERKRHKTLFRRAFRLLQASIYGAANPAEAEADHAAVWETIGPEGRDYAVRTAGLPDDRLTGLDWYDLPPSARVRLRRELFEMVNPPAVELPLTAGERRLLRVITSECPGAARREQFAACRDLAGKLRRRGERFSEEEIAELRWLNSREVARIGRDRPEADLHIRVDERLLTAQEMVAWANPLDRPAAEFFDLRCMEEQLKLAWEKRDRTYRASAPPLRAHVFPRRTHPECTWEHEVLITLPDGAESMIASHGPFDTEFAAMKAAERAIGSAERIVRFVRGPSSGNPDAVAVAAPRPVTRGTRDAEAVLARLGVEPGTWVSPRTYFAVLSELGAMLGGMETDVRTYDEAVRILREQVEPEEVSAALAPGTDVDGNPRRWRRARRPAANPLETMAEAMPASVVALPALPPASGEGEDRPVAVDPTTADERGETIATDAPAGPALKEAKEAIP